MKPTLTTKLINNHSLRPDYSWVFNERGGKKVFDSSQGLAGDFNANVSGYPTWIEDSVLFDSNGESIIGPNGSIFTGANTVIFGYKQTAAPSSYYYWFVLDDDYQELSFIYNPLGGANSQSLSINSTAWNRNTCEWIDGEYHNICVQWIDTTNMRYLYLDGVLLDSSNTTTEYDSAGLSDHNLQIGGRLTGADRYAGGKIYYFYIWNRILTPGEISLLHSNPYQVFYKTPIWMFDYVDVGGISIPVVMLQHDHFGGGQMEVHSG